MQRRHRLRNASDFALLRKHGQRYHHPLLMLVVRPNEAAASRFGFSASRQVGKATARNRAKRLMRESVRSYNNRIPGGWDCLFIARHGAEAATLDEIKEAVGQLLSRARILAQAG
jgi:ribonuclease P protein component